VISPISIIALLAAGTFAWHGLSAIRTGEARIPIQLFGLDSYDREHTLYWGVVALNFALSAALLGIAYATRESGF
jgi:hypothetical protein